MTIQYGKYLYNTFTGHWGKVVKEERTTMYIYNKLNIIDKIRIFFIRKVNK